MTSYHVACGLLPALQHPRYDPGEDGTSPDADIQNLPTHTPYLISHVIFFTEMNYQFSETL